MTLVAGDPRHNNGGHQKMPAIIVALRPLANADGVEMRLFG